MLLEMGFGTILIFNLYKPLTSGDQKEIERQLSIFKTIYSTISFVIIGIALTVAPFLFNVFNIDFADKLAVYVIYFSNVIHVIVKYAFLNKASILAASQNKYIEVYISIAVDFGCFVLRLLSLFAFKNLYLYLLAQLLLPSLTYYLENLWVNRHYQLSKIKFSTFKEIKESDVLKQCHKYIYATIYELVFYSMDNIIISIALSTDSIAYVSNYFGLIKTVAHLIVLVLTSFRGVVANYYHSYQSDEGMYQIYDVYAAFNFIFVAIVSVGMYCMIDDFIALWIGPQYIIAQEIKLILIITLAINGIFEALNNIFTIKGYIFKEKWFLITSALTNLVLTILLIKPMGIFGAYLATMIAQLIRWSGKFFFIMQDTFRNHRLAVLGKLSGYLIIVLIEMNFIDKILNRLFIGPVNILSFIYQSMTIVVLVSIINGLVVLFNKNVREYLNRFIVKIRGRV